MGTRVRRGADDRGLNGAGRTATESGAEPHGERPLAAAIDERVSRDGAVLRPLDADEVHRGIALLAVTGVEAIAVCFLHSRRYPTHEHAVAALAEREFPGTRCHRRPKWCRSCANTNARRRRSPTPSSSHRFTR